MRYPGMVDRSILSGGIFRGNAAIKLFVRSAKVLNYFMSFPRMYSLFSYLLMPKNRNQVARRVYQMQARRLTQKEYMKWVGLYAEFFALLRRFYDEQLRFPALVVMGGDDYVFLAAAKSFVARQPNAQLAEIPETGHICNIESADSFNQLAYSFLRHSNAQ